MCCLVKAITHIREWWQMNMQQWWANDYQRKPKETQGENLPKCHFIRYISHLMSPATEPQALPPDHSTKLRALHSQLTLHRRRTGELETCGSGSYTCTNSGVYTRSGYSGSSQKRIRNTNTYNSVATAAFINHFQTTEKENFDYFHSPLPSSSPKLQNQQASLICSMHMKICRKWKKIITKS